MQPDLPKKTKPTLWLLGFVLLACILAGLLLHVADTPSSSTPSEEPVVVCGDITLDNTQLGYYFWSEYSYYLMSLGNQIPATLDMSKPLSDQMYDDSSTWQDYILGKTMTTVEETLAMVNAAMVTDYQLPIARQAELDANLASFAETPLELGLLNEDGTADVDAYIQQSYGEDASLETLSEYLYHSYLADAYADYLYNLPVFTDQEVETYYDDNGGTYWDNSVYKTDEKLSTIRIVLQSPTNLTDTVAWENAEKAAETLYATWQSEGGNQDDFSAMAAAYSSDAITRYQGGLMAEISQSSLTGELATWVFAEDRQPGDTGLVKSESGWVIVYYVEETDTTLWQKTAEADLRAETFQNAFAQIMLDYPTTVTEKNIALVELENYVQTVQN
ncbi:MAG: peptidylprolyl isomerase [Eubacteriales bacterium]